MVNQICISLFKKVVLPTPLWKIASVPSAKATRTRPFTWLHRGKPEIIMYINASRVYNHVNESRWWRFLTQSPRQNPSAWWSEGTFSTALQMSERTRWNRAENTQYISVLSQCTYRSFPVVYYYWITGFKNHVWFGSIHWWIIQNDFLNWAWE